MSNLFHLTNILDLYRNMQACRASGVPSLRSSNPGNIPAFVKASKSDCGSKVVIHSEYGLHKLSIPTLADFIPPIVNYERKPSKIKSSKKRQCISMSMEEREVEGGKSQKWCRLKSSPKGKIILCFF